MTRRFAGECFLAGVLAGVGIIGAYAARTAWAITKGHRWADVVRLTDIGAKRVH